MATATISPSTPAPVNPKQPPQPKSASTSSSSASPTTGSSGATTSLINPSSKQRPITKPTITLSTTSTKNRFYEVIDDSALFSRLMMYSASHFCPEIALFLEEYQQLKAKVVAFFNMGEPGFDYPELDIDIDSDKSLEDRLNQMNSHSKNNHGGAAPGSMRSFGGDSKNSFNGHQGNINNNNSVASGGGGRRNSKSFIYGNNGGSGNNNNNNNGGKTVNSRNAMSSSSSHISDSPNNTTTTTNNNNNNGGQSKNNKIKEMFGFNSKKNSSSSSNNPGGDGGDSKSLGMSSFDGSSSSNLSSRHSHNNNNKKQQQQSQAHSRQSRILRTITPANGSGSGTWVLESIPPFSSARITILQTLLESPAGQRTVASLTAAAAAANNNNNSNSSKSSGGRSSSDPVSPTTTTTTTSNNNNNSSGSNQQQQQQQLKTTTFYVNNMTTIAVNTDSCSLASFKVIPFALRSQFYGFYRIFIAEGGTLQINIEGRIMDRITKLIESYHYTVDMLDEVHGEVLQMLYQNIYRKFIRSFDSTNNNNNSSSNNNPGGSNDIMMRFSNPNTPTHIGGF
ncbi:hypothetical protein H4219_002574 [Mycoemilia scoparia]|uniref:RGS domain-containing protein n=1 Tax=Mycoemilia scoparia TaxID=417184 RepID=A0A9W8DNY0_9FUNG|nr:hypothetical protein H4219_002574 [Mycoemilia scoparia]